MDRNNKKRKKRYKQQAESFSYLQYIMGVIIPMLFLNSY